MVDFLTDRAELARLQDMSRGRPDLASPNPAPSQYPWQATDDVTGYPVLPFENPHLPRYEVSRFSLGAGNVTVTTFTVTVDRAPQLWLVTNRNIANTNVLVYLSDIASGIPIDLGPGGTLKVPAHGHRQITVANIGSGTAVGNVIALSGPGDFIQNVAVSPG